MNEFLILPLAVIRLMVFYIEEIILYLRFIKRHFKTLFVSYNVIGLKLANNSFIQPH